MMNPKNSKLKTKNRAKIKKLDHYHDERNSKAVDEFPSTSAIESPSILDMPFEIIELIFDYLHIVELNAVSKTCMWMQQMSQCWFQQTYSGVFIYFKKEEDIETIHMFRFMDTFIRVEHFIPVIDKIRIQGKGWTFKNTGQDVPCLIDQQFQQLKHLTIRGTNFTNININKMKGVLSQLEYMSIHGCKMNDAFLENLLNLTPNIKRLFLDDIHTENKWLQRNYPTLEHCEIISETFVPITEFLTYNPNIRKLGTNLINAWKNMHLIKASGINLDVLAILSTDWDRLSDLDLRSFWRLIDEHCLLGIYKRVHLIYRYCFRQFNQRIVDKIVVSSGVNRFSAMDIERFEGLAYVELSALNFLANVKDFSFLDSRLITDIETVAYKLESLKRIRFGKTNLSHVKIFIRGNVKLQEIEIDWFVDEVGMVERMKILNLIELNKERAVLANAEKITLFVQEPVYLATKQVSRETVLEFIKLKRTDTLNERHFDFDYPTVSTYCSIEVTDNLLIL